MESISNFFDNLPDESKLESVINEFDKDQIVELMHIGRNRVIQNPEHVPSEIENRAMILVVRRFRGLREARKPGTKKAAAKPQQSLGSIFGI